MKYGAFLLRDHYIGYKALKKLVKKGWNLELEANMVQALDMHVEFVQMLEENVIVTETFFQEQLAKLSARADEVSALISNALSSGKDASTGPAEFKKGPQAQAIDALVELEAETEELLFFAGVNRRAVAKILKKFVKRNASVDPDLVERVKSCVEAIGIDQPAIALATVRETVNACRLQVTVASGECNDYLAHATAESNARRAIVDGVSVEAAAPGDRAAARKSFDAAAGERTIDCPCGLRVVYALRLSEMWRDKQRRRKYLLTCSACFGLLVCVIIIIAAQPERLGRLTALGIAGATLVAVANGANDIANSVGTSVGAGALTLRQAIVMGAFAECLGAMTLGSLVAKTISKGVIDPDEYAADGCQGSITFAVAMACVLLGTGFTTLLATLYGLPISASHSVIGGLIAVGLVTKGGGSLGAASLVKTVIAWVASPVIGCVAAGLVHIFIVRVVHSVADPGVRSKQVQPIFVTLAVAISAAFILIKGPKAIRLKPPGLAVGVSVAIGVGVAILAFLAQRARRALRARSGAPDEPTAPSTSTAEVEVAVDEGGSNSPFGARFPRAKTDGAAEKKQPKKFTRRASNFSALVQRSKKQASRLEAAEKPFVPLLILSAFTVAFAHGGNDVGNAVGPLSSILEVTRKGELEATPTIDYWVLAIGSAGFVIGIVLLGSRTIATVGGKITKLTPSRSFAVQMGAAIAVLSSTILGLAVSTSHCLVGAVVGIGLAEVVMRRGSGQLNTKVLVKILIGWGATIPLAMLVSVIAYFCVSPAYDDYSTTEVCEL